MASNYTVDIDVNKVKSVNISRYSDGYNYASVSSRITDDEYMSVSYEWRGKEIPEFAMNVMEIIKSLGMEKAAVDEDISAYLERASKVLGALAVQMKNEDVIDK